MDNLENITNYTEIEYLKTICEESGGKWRGIEIFEECEKLNESECFSGNYKGKCMAIMDPLNGLSLSYKECKSLPSCLCPRHKEWNAKECS